MQVKILEGYICIVTKEKSLGFYRGNKIEYLAMDSTIARALAAELNKKAEELDNAKADK